MAYTTIDDPTEYFETVLWTGNATGRNIAVNFQPDFIWTRNRDDTTFHLLYDSTRGAGKALRSNVTNVESSFASDEITAFISTGFTIGTGGDVNANTEKIVAWNWKANGGSRTTFTESGANPGGGYQANTTAGFSIVDYTGTGSAGTVSHGLGAEPKVLIVKNRDATTDWAVYHRNASSAGNDSYLELNTSDAVATAGTVWNDTSPSSSVFTVGTNTKTNTDGEKYIAYCFTEVKGYSKFGSYTGNASANGPFVYTGFKPAWVMVKNAGGVDNWALHDHKRPGYNGNDGELFPNENYAESTGTIRFDFLSNGFKIRHTGSAINSNGQNIVYMAFAENPFVTSKGAPTTAE